MQIFLVGGAVRDMVMDLEPKDFDFVVVGSSVDEMLSLGFHLIEAQSFPVFHHPISGNEFALARRERKVGEGYHGFSVETDEVTLEEDLSRRDLTMNAMAIESNTNLTIKDGQFHQVGRVIDPFHGTLAIDLGVISHVSDAFEEDPVRVLRCARFAARYEFDVAQQTLDKMRAMVARGDLDHLTKERVWLELSKVMAERAPSRFFMVLSAIDALHVVKHISTSPYGLDFAPVMDLPQRFALMFADGDTHSSDEAVAALTSLGAPNAVITFVDRFLRTVDLLDALSSKFFGIERELDAEIVMRVIEVFGATNPGNDAFAAVTEPMTAFSTDMLRLWRFVTRCIVAVRMVNFDPNIEGKLSGPAIAASLRARRIEAIRAISGP